MLSFSQGNFILFILFFFLPPLKLVNQIKPKLQDKITDNLIKES